MKTRLLTIIIITFTTASGTISLLNAINCDMTTEFYSTSPFGYQENIGNAIFGQELENKLFAPNSLYSNEYYPLDGNIMNSSPSDDDDELIYYTPIGEGLGILMIMLLMYIGLKVRRTIKQ